MTLVHQQITGRYGNQLFQYWVGKLIAKLLNRPLSVTFGEPIRYIDSETYTNLEFPDNNHSGCSVQWGRVDPDNGYYCFRDDQDIDNIQEIVDKHINSNVPVILRFNAEDYSLIRKYESFVKQLYKRDNSKTPKQNIIAIHVRLGDGTHLYTYHNAYKESCAQICAKYDIPVVIVTENTEHPLILDLKNYLNVNTNNSVSILQGDANNWKEHFDTLYSASVLIVTHSTFSWWAAYLNPYDPHVYMMITYSQPAHLYKNDKLIMKDSPDTWNIYDIDHHYYCKTSQLNWIPSISLVITTFNRYDTFLKDNLLKYLDNHFIKEIVVYDDASEDYSKTLNGFSDHAYSNKIKLYRQHNNKGALRNKIIACNAATCDWICLMDSDNFADINYFEAWLNHCIANGYDQNKIYAPSHALPVFDFSEYVGCTIDKHNFNNTNGCLINDGNHIFHKSAVQYLIPIVYNEVNPYALDVKYMIYYWFKNGITMDVVPGMSYNHAMHEGSFWVSCSGQSEEFDKSFNWDFKS